MISILTHLSAQAAFSDRSPISVLVFDFNVLSSQFVPSRTMESRDRDLSGAECFHVDRSGGGKEPTQDIDASGNSFEMIRVDTAFDPAEMVDLQSFGDRPLGVFVSETVRLNTGTASPGGDSSIIAAYHAFPHPTAAKRDGDAALKQFVERGGEMLQSGHSLWSLSGGSRSGMPVDRQSHRYSVSTMEYAHG